MEKFNRAERRNQTARLKKARRNYWGYNRSSWSEREMDPKQLGRVVQNPQTCSCMGCGNGRRYFGQTLSEVCQQLALEEQLRESVGQTEIGVPHNPKLQS